MNKLKSGKSKRKKKVLRSEEEKRKRNRWRNGSVEDKNLKDEKKVGEERDRLNEERNGGGEGVLINGRLLGNIEGRMIKREIEKFK